MPERTPSGPAVSRVDFCLTTFKRPHAIERLILSIGERYPEAAVFIADQNERLDCQFYEKLAMRSGLVDSPTVYHLEFDCGVSAARNHLVCRSPRDYKLILDDDAVVIDRSDVGTLVRLLDSHPGAGVVGAAQLTGEGVRGARSNFQREGETLINVPDRQPFCDHEGIRHVQVDCVAQFCLIRRELLDVVQWDPGLKTFEHHDFFIRVKETSYDVLFTPDVMFGHISEWDAPGYLRFRWRPQYMKRLLQKHGLTRLTFDNLSGWELRPDGTVAPLQTPEDRGSAEPIP